MPSARSAFSGPKRIALNGRVPSRRLLRACCRFGIGVSREVSALPASPDLDALCSLLPGSLALITGPSGCGKSRLLKHLRANVKRTIYCDLSACGRERSGSGGSVIDLLALPLDRALRLLAAAGLADPFVLGRTVRELSVGERARFSLARALARRPDWLLIDEFLTTLDRETAFGVARSFRRAAREFAPCARIVVATAHEDVAAHLNADVVVRLASAEALIGGSPLKRAETAKAKQRGGVRRGTAAEAAA